MEKTDVSIKRAQAGSANREKQATKTNVILADNQDLTRFGMTRYVEKIFGGSANMATVSNKKLLAKQNNK